MLIHFIFLCKKKITVFTWTLVSDLWGYPVFFFVCTCKHHIRISVSGTNPYPNFWETRFCHLENSRRKQDTVACVLCILDTDSAKWRITKTNLAGAVGASSFWSDEETESCLFLAEWILHSWYFRWEKASECRSLWLCGEQVTGHCCRCPVPRHEVDETNLQADVIQQCNQPTWSHFSFLLGAVKNKHCRCLRK